MTRRLVVLTGARCHAITKTRHSKKSNRQETPRACLALFIQIHTASCVRAPFAANKPCEKSIKITITYWYRVLYNKSTVCKYTEYCSVHARLENELRRIRIPAERNKNIKRTTQPSHTSEDVAFNHCRCGVLLRTKHPPNRFWTTSNLCHKLERAHQARFCAHLRLRPRVVLLENDDDDQACIRYRRLRGDEFCWLACGGVLSDKLWCLARELQVGGGRAVGGSVGIWSYCTIIAHSQSPQGSVFTTRVLRVEVIRTRTQHIVERQYRGLSSRLFPTLLVSAIFSTCESCRQATAMSGVGMGHATCVSRRVLFSCATRI